MSLCCLLSSFEVVQYDPSCRFNSSGGHFILGTSYVDSLFSISSIMLAVDRSEMHGGSLFTYLVVCFHCCYKEIMFQG